MAERKQKSVWGPALWLYLHAAADFCDEPEAFASLVLSLVGTLPCPECRKHLKEYTSRMPPASFITDKPSAVKYVKDLHNHVNSLIGKPPHPPARTAFSFPAATFPRVAATTQAHAGGLPRPSLPPSAIQQQRPAGPRAPRAAAAPRFRRH